MREAADALVDARAEIASLVRKAGSPEALEAKLAAWRPNDESWEQLGDAIFVPAVLSDLAGQLMVRGSEAHVIQLDAKDKPAFLDLPWADAIEEFKARGILKPTELSTLLKDYAQRSDKARQLMLGQVQTFVRSELERSLREGGTFRDFSKAIDNGDASLGITNSDPAYLNMVFRTNVQSAYGAGRFRAMTDPDVIGERPYAEYRTVGDARVRPDHAVLDGTVYALASDTWKRICPPNSYNCRCAMVTLTRDEASGRDILDDVPSAYVPTPGFDGPPVARVNAPTPKLAPALRQQPLSVPGLPAAPVSAPVAPSATKPEPTKKVDLKRTPAQLEKDRAATVIKKLGTTQQALADGKHVEMRKSLRDTIASALPGIKRRAATDSDKVNVTAENIDPVLAAGGGMTISEDLKRKVAAGDWQAAKALVHEEIHGHGPAIGAEAFGGKAGHALEEAITERLARHVMATRPGADSDDHDLFRNGTRKTEARLRVGPAYQDLVEGVRNALKAAGSKDPDEDFLRAATAFKSQGDVAGNYVDAFAKLAAENPAVDAEKLIEALSKLSTY